MRRPLRRAKELNIDYKFVAPAGIEPAPEVPETSVLSIILRRRAIVKAKLAINYEKHLFSSPNRSDYRYKKEENVKT